MDLTDLARTLLEPIPANRSAGLRVVRAADGVGEVAIGPAPGLANVIGSLHSSGLVALLDAAGLAAIIGAAGDEAQFDGVIPLGASAELRFLAPARGDLLARCALDEPTMASLHTLFDGSAAKVKVTTTATVTDTGGTEVCTGAFHWSLRRATA